MKLIWRSKESIFRTEKLRIALSHLKLWIIIKVLKERLMEISVLICILLNKRDGSRTRSLKLLKPMISKRVRKFALSDLR